MKDYTKVLIDALRAVVNDADDTGCEDCYVVSANVIDKVRRVLEKVEAKA